MSGRTSPHGLLIPRVNSMLEKVDAAVRRGDLPLHPSTPKRERSKHLRRILKIRGSSC